MSDFKFEDAIEATVEQLGRMMSDTPVSSSETPNSSGNHFPDSTKKMDGDTIYRHDAIIAACEGADEWDGGRSIGRDEVIEKYIKAIPSVNDGGDLIRRRAAIEAMRTCYDTELKEFDNGDEFINYDQAVRELESLPPASNSEIPNSSGNHSADSDKMVDGDLIYRQAAIDVLNVGTELLRRVLDDADIVGVERAKYEWGLGLIESYISDMKELPSAQPDSNESSSTHKALDIISRQAAIDTLERKKDKNAKGDIGGFYNKIIQNDIDALNELPPAQPEIIYCKDCKNSEHWYRDRRRCFLWSENGVSVFGDGFCNYAERKHDG